MASRHPVRQSTSTAFAIAAKTSSAYARSLTSYRRNHWSNIRS